MIEWTFVAEDVARTRFAYSPLREAVYSIATLSNPRQHVLHAGWAISARARMRNVDLRALTDVVAGGPSTVPDFLTPAPAHPAPEIIDELAAVRAVAGDQVRAELGILPATPTRTRLESNPLGTIRTLADLLETYWQLALAPVWPRLRDTFDADVRYRAGQIARAGALSLFGDLHDTIHWSNDRLRVANRHDHATKLDGRGLLLMPSAFVWPHVTVSCDEPHQATLTYPARGIGGLWKNTPPSAQSLADLIGRTRAEVLSALDQPATTSELARRLTATPSGVSQHLAVLHNAGLVNRSRDGRKVLYSRSTAGDSMMNSPRRP